MLGLLRRLCISFLGPRFGRACFGLRCLAGRGLVEAFVVGFGETDLD